VYNQLKPSDRSGITSKLKFFDPNQKDFLRSGVKKASLAAAAREGLIFYEFNLHV
jgi:hypothetical protein